MFTMFMDVECVLTSNCVVDKSVCDFLLECVVVVRCRFKLLIVKTGWYCQLSPGFAFSTTYIAMEQTPFLLFIFLNGFTGKKIY